MGVDSKLGELFAAGLAMGFGCLGVAASVVGLPINLLLVTLGAATRRKADGRHEDIGRSPDLFQRQQLTAENIFARRQLLANSRAKQLAQDRDVQMPMDAAPTATLEVIQTEFLFGLAKAVLDRPPPKCDSQKLSQRPTIATGHAVGEKVLRLTRQQIASDDERALVADQLSGVRLSPAGVPTGFPDLTAAASFLDAVALRSLLAKRGRVLREVLNFAGLSLTLA